MCLSYQMDIDSGEARLLYRVITQISGQPKGWQSGAPSLSSSLCLKVRNMEQNMSPCTNYCLGLLLPAGYVGKASVIREYIRCGKYHD